MGGTNGTERDRFFTHRLITRARLDAREKLVLFALWDFENSRTGLAWPSGDTLAACTGMSRRNVVRSIAELTRAGVLRVDSRRGLSVSRLIDYNALVALCAPGPTTETPRLTPETPRLTSEPIRPSSETPWLTNRRRTQEEKKREHAPPTFLSASRKDPKARHPGASGASAVTGDPEHDRAEAEFLERVRAMAIEACRELGGEA